MPHEIKEPGIRGPGSAIAPLEGPKLAELIRGEGGLNPSWVLTIMESLATSLHVHHGGGIVFGNVRPDRIVVRESDGAARLLDPLAKTDATPEDDIRDLVATMYEALCGVPPGEHPPAPVREHAPDLDPQLDTFFAERFDSAIDLRDAIRGIRGVPAGIVVEHVPPPAAKTVDAGTAAASRRWPIVVAGAALLVVLVSVFILVGGRTTEPVAEIAAVDAPAPTPRFTVRDPDPEPVEATPPPAPSPVAPAAAAEPVKAAPAPKPRKETPPAPAPVEVAPVEAPPIEVAPAPAAPVESAPPVTAPTLATITVVLKNSVRDGSLTLLADGIVVFETELAVDGGKWRNVAKKAVGRGREESALTIEVPAGTHRIMARMVDTKGRDYEESITLDLESGATPNLRIVTGKSIGKRLKLELD